MAVVQGPDTCFACGEPVEAADSFCESCGAELAPLKISDGQDGGPGACESCGSSSISADGYRSLSEGIKVSYEEEASPKGPKAVNVTKL